MIEKTFQAILFWQKKEIMMSKCISCHITSNFSKSPMSTIGDQ